MEGNGASPFVHACRANPQKPGSHRGREAQVVDALLDVDDVAWPSLVKS